MSLSVPAEQLRQSRGTGAELCRVSILGENTQMDIALPAAVPIAALIPELVSLVEGRTPDILRRPTDATQQYWTLQRIGQAPFNDSRTLAELGVRDGDLLLLRPESVADSPPLFDDVIDAVALVADERYKQWTATSARIVGCVASVLAAAAGALVLLRGYADAPGLGQAAAALAAALVLLVAGVIVSRVYRSPLAGTTLSGCAYAFTFAGGALIVPGSLGAPHLLLGAALTLTVAVITLRISGTGVLVNTAVVTSALLLGGAGLVGSLLHDEVPAIGAGLAVVALLGIVAAPRLTIMLARLPLPPVPTSGTSADDAEPELRSDIADIGPVGAMALPSTGELEQRTIRANNYLTGLFAGFAVAAVIGALVGCDVVGGPNWPGTALAAVVAVVLMLRGRSCTDLAQAVTLVASGVVLIIAALIALTLADPSASFACFGVAALTVLAGIIFGVVVPAQEYSPVLRRTAELLEYALIAVIAPLAAWVMDLYSFMRGL